tara:strand:+ start:30730 stop:37086 length:6357 start_codon:yes stop_codon:yes gene_type:complete
MYFVSPKLKFVLFSVFFTIFISFSTFSQTPDFKVQHIQDDIARIGGSNSGFTAVSSLNNVVELANNNRKTHAGRSDLSAINLDGDDLAGARQLINTSTLNYYREGGSINSNMRFNTSLWEYVGPAAGNNELIVRGRYAISLNGATNSITQVLSGITNANNCIPFITGIMNSSGNDDADSGTAIAYLENSTTLRVQKGSNANNVTVYITVVEFTGSNWNVLHGDSGNTDGDFGSITLRGGSDGTGTVANVSAWSEAVTFSHFRADNNVNGIDDAISDLWPVIDPGADNQTLDWTFHSQHVSAQGTNRHFVHVLNNTNLNVTRFQNTSSTANETTIDITSAGLTSISEAFIVGSSISSGTGTAYGRGWRNYYLNSTTQAAHWAHRSGNTMAHEIQIVDLSGLTTAISGPEINIQGGSPLIDILDGNTAISTTDDTDFGSIDISSGSNSNVFTIENNGTTDLIITSVTGGTADFVISGTTSGTITAGNSITFTVTFNPSTVGTKTATISIANNDTTGGEDPYTFNVEGIGTTTTYSEVTVSVDWPSWSSENRVEVYSPSGTLITTIDNGYAGGADDSYGPITFNLGCLEDLNNYYFIMYDTYGDGWNGTDNITITSSGVEVINDPDENLNGGALPGGRTVNFNVSGGICGGEINVTGNGTSIANGETITSLSDFTDFGDIDMGSSNTRTFTIENTGGTDLTIGSSVTLATGTLFTVTTQPASTVLATGTSTTFVITFSPLALGTFTDIVTITSDDSNEDPYTFSISGNSLTPLTIGPGGIVSDLKLWLKSTSGLGYGDGAAVSLWQTNARGSNATVNTVGQEPTFFDNTVNNVNFNPVISFNNDRFAAPQEYDYTYTPQQYLEGVSGFYTQEFFIVAIPDDTVNSTYTSMDLFCGDSPLVDPNERDGTGIGYGTYSVRFDDESIAFAIGTSADTGTPAIDRGYGIADTNTSSSYNGVAILNVRDNSSAPIDGSELYYNGNNIVSDEVGVPQFINVEDSRFWIGRSQGFRASFEGRVAEIITYNLRKDDTTERNKIQSYLAIKYGITLGVNGTSQDYVDSSGALIWDINTGVPVNDVFNYNITGIGRDDASELNQKQSKTVNTANDITIGLNEIATTNNLNTNTFTTDKTFLVWGNDNAVLTGGSSVVVDMSEGILPLGSLTTNVEFTPILRKWKVASKGTTFSAKVSIPETLLIPLGPPPGDYLMFVSDSPTFSPSSEYRIMSSDGLGNFQANYTFSTTKYITFGFAPEKTFVRSIQFDGAVDYLDAGDVLDINTPTTAFTISAWIKRENTSASIVSKRDNGFTTGYNFGINGSGNLEMSWNGGSETITSSVPIPTSIWHHVAVIYDGTDAKLYIDGVEDITQTTVLAAPIDNSESFLIAAADGDEVNTTSFFEGNIDEVRVWDVALTEDQLRFVMNQEIEDNTNVDGSYFASLGILPTKNDINAVPWANLIGYYPMSTYTFTNCKDASGNGNTAALKNLNTVDNQTAPLPYQSSADGAWDTPVTWLNNTVQSIPNSLSIVDGVTPIDWNIVEISDNNILTSGSRDIKVLGLNIISNSIDAIDTKLTINGDTAAGTGNGLSVTHYLKLDGILDLEGESQLIQTIGSDLDIASIGHLERDQQGEGNKYRYNDWSSPVILQGAGNFSSDGITPISGTPFSIANVLKDGTNANAPVDISFVGGQNGLPGPPIQIANYWLYKYANLTGLYSEWDQIGSTGNLYAGEGFLMKGTGEPGASDQNYVFVGKPNNGTIILSVSGNNEYLVGNPYPSAIDTRQFLIDNSPSGTGSVGGGGAIYFWEHYGGDTHNLKDYQAGYATRNLVSGVPATSHSSVSNLGIATKTPGPFIAVGQGFFVLADADGGFIEFNNGQRIFEKEFLGNSVFMKNSTTKSKITTKNIADERPKFRIGFDAPAINHRQILLAFDEKATDAVDWGYDAEIYEIFEDDMYWMIDDKKYIIQATNTFSLDKEVPLGIQTANDGNIRIKVDELENVAENISVYIKDNLTGETYNIKEQAFEVDLEAGDYKNRFVLTFQPRLKTLEEVALFEGVSIYMNNDISELQINRIVDTEVERISLFNYLGQQVSVWNSSINERFVSLPIKMATGVYIVRVHTAAGLLTKKIIIK